MVESAWRERSPLRYYTFWNFLLFTCTALVRKWSEILFAPSFISSVAVGIVGPFVTWNETILPFYPATWTWSVAMVGVDAVLHQLPWFYLWRRRSALCTDRWLRRWTSALVLPFAAAYLSTQSPTPYRRLTASCSNDVLGVAVLGCSLGVYAAHLAPPVAEKKNKNKK